MRINSQFDLGEKVFPILKTKSKVYKDCDFCPDVGGWIFSVDKTQRRQCPVCRGDCKLLDYLIEEYVVEASITVRKIRLEVTARGTSDEIYADWETGGGRFHYAERLYSTNEKAQAECDKRNEKILDQQAIIDAEKERQNAT